MCTQSLISIMLSIYRPVGIISALGVSHVMRYINLRYLLTYFIIISKNNVTVLKKQRLCDVSSHISHTWHVRLSCMQQCTRVTMNTHNDWIWDNTNNIWYLLFHWNLNYRSFTVSHLWITSIQTYTVSQLRLLWNSNSRNNCSKQ